MSLKRGVFLFMALVCLGLVALDLKQTIDARYACLEGAAQNTSNLAHSLALQAEGVVSTANSVLINLRDRLAFDGRSPAAMAHLELFMREQIAAEPHIHGIFVYDEMGNWIANTVPGSPKGVNYADRDWFIHFSNEDDPAVFIGLPVQSKVDQTWVIPITRRLNRPDGSFAGVVDVTISTDLFQRFYETFSIGKRDIITLSDDHGRVLVRRPFNRANIGRQISNGSAIMKSLGSHASGTFEFTSFIDQQPRLGSAEKVPNYPLRIMVAQDRSDLLAPWKERAITNLALFVAMMLCIVATGLRLLRQVTTQAEVETRYRLLADNSTDAIICIDPNGHRRYVSPAFWSMTGWCAEKCAGKTAFDFVCSDDHANLRAALSKLSGSARSEGCRFRYHLAKGGFMWVEAHAKEVRTSDGKVIEYIRNIRDITDQKRAEDAIAEANAALEALAMIDPLTGIANRRQFDLVLQREWNSAMRTGQPVALLMIDADRFKAFNDRYGHLRGDDCLRSIAKIIANTIRRHTDVATRYGGEEFAVVLPGATAEDAHLIADRIRMSLMQAAIAHEGNEVSIATVSIGVASFVPVRDMDAQLLIKRADEALYEAKDLGRNRVVVGALPITRLHLIPSSKFR